MSNILLYKVITLCKGKLTNAWGLGGLVNAHSKLNYNFYLIMFVNYHYRIEELIKDIC